MANLAANVRGGRLQRLRQRIAQRGPRATIAKAWGDHVFRHSASVILEYHRVWGGRVTPPEPRAGQSFAVVRDPAEMPPLCAWLNPRADDFARMAAKGKVGLFVLRDGVAVGCAWMALSDHHDPASREFYPVSAGEVYHYCWLVEPGHRSQGAALPLARYMMALCAQLGISRQFGVVDRVNRASYRILQHYGYRECGQLVRHLYILGTRWTVQSRYAGTLGLAASARKAMA